jgi:hypothetical protein
MKKTSEQEMGGRHVSKNNDLFIFSHITIEHIKSFAFSDQFS